MKIKTDLIYNKNIIMLIFNGIKRTLGLIYSIFNFDGFFLQSNTIAIITIFPSRK